jgi:hypothetical protein
MNNKPKTKTLPAVRIESKTNSNIQEAIKKINEESIVEISLQDFRRIAYEFTSQKILLGEKIKLQS